MPNRGNGHWLTFILTMVVVWGLGTYAFIYFAPHFVYNRLKRALVKNGLGITSGVPVNTLYALPYLASPSTAKSRLLLTGNNDTLYTFGALELGQGPEILHVPDMAGRYYSIEMIDMWGDVVGSVGRRVTGTKAGDFLISGPGWQGRLPGGVKQIALPGNSLLLIGRTLVQNGKDVPAAYGLDQQIRLTPLSRWQSGQ